MELWRSLYGSERGRILHIASPCNIGSNTSSDSPTLSPTIGNVAYRGEQALPTDPRTYLQLRSMEVPGSSQYYTVASVEPRNDFVIPGFEAEFRGAVPGAVPGSFGVRSSNQNLKANDCEIIIKSQ